MENLKINNMSGKGHLILFLAFMIILGFGFNIEKQKEGAFAGLYDTDPTKAIKDSITVINHLNGEWIWDSTACPELGTLCYSGYYYKIIFYRNFVLDVYRNNELVASTKWGINRKGKDFYIVTNPKVENVEGIINIKGKSLRFRNSDFNGYDYYFSCNF
jgi:hypothetical protein